MSTSSLNQLSKLKKVVIFLGLPGSGKGRTIDVLCEVHPEITSFSTGEYFRKIAKCNDQTSMLIKQTIAAGELVSDELTFGVIQEQAPLILKDEHTHLCIDGFPRNVSQADFLMETSLSVVVVEIVGLTDEFCCDRILKSEDRKNRTDDVEETVRKRIELHHKVTDPVSKYFKEKYPNLYYSIDGKWDAKERAQVVREILGFSSISHGANEAGLELPSPSQSAFRGKPQPHPTGKHPSSPLVPTFSLEDVPDNVRQLAQR